MEMFDSEQFDQKEGRLEKLSKELLRIPEEAHELRASVFEIAAQYPDLEDDENRAKVIDSAGQYQDRLVEIVDELSGDERARGLIAISLEMALIWRKLNIKFGEMRSLNEGTRLAYHAHLEEEFQIILAEHQEVVLGNWRSFLQETTARIEAEDINIEGLVIDHVGYRVSTEEEYDRKKMELMSLSHAWTETEHNGRQISKFLLSSKLEFRNRKIPMIELPSPKDGYEGPFGLEHLEVVVDDYEEFKEKYKDRWTNETREGEFNPTLTVTFNNGVSAKFHSRSLEDVVKLEGNKFVDVDMD